MTKIAKRKTALKYKPEEELKPLHQDFFYKPRRKSIDWRMLSSINVDEITRDNNITVLQKCIDNITFCDIYESEEIQDADQNLVKMFQLSQLIIEFLLHSQKFLISDKETAKKRLEMMEISVSTATEQYEKTKRVLEEKQKEIKALKKALFAFELMAKNPQKHSQPEATSFHRCRYCSKAFSTDKYLQAHESRRHGDIVSDNEGDLSVKPTKPKQEQTGELKMVAELIEKFTNHLSEKENEKKDIVSPEKALAEKLAVQLEQEKLRFETEMQAFKSSMHREIEEERQILREDRKAFESLVNANSKTISHVGELEDEDEESRNSKANAKHDMEKKFSKKIDKIKKEILKENATKSMTLEMKLEMAAEEINRLKAEKANRENASQVEHTPPKLKISVPEYESAPVASKSEKIALSPSGISKRETWKKYVGVLKEQNCTPNPHAKWATSKYHHPVGEMQSEKELLSVDIDQFLAERGITEVNIAKLSSDPALKAITTQLSGYIDGQRQASSQIEFYDEMRAYLENQVESAAAVAFNQDIVSPTGEPPVNRTFRKSINSQLQTSPSRSSLRKTSSGNALAKNVKLAEVAEERVIIPQTTKTKYAALSPLKGLDISAPTEDLPTTNSPTKNLQPASSVRNDSPYQPVTPLQYGEASSPKIFSSVKNAFSMIAKSLTSPSKAKPNYGAQFDYAMRAGSPPAGRPILPPREPKKYLDIPRERIKSVSSTSETGTSTGILCLISEESSEEESSSTSKAVIPLSSPEQAAIKPHKRDASQTETSFSVSEISEAGENRRVLDFDHHNRDIDAFDLLTEEDENLPPLTIKKPQAPQKIPSSVSKNNAAISDDDDDVLEFLDEIDASLDVRTTGKISEIVNIDDIDDFDT